MTLTWNNSEEWADGCGDAGPHGGLTAARPRGRGGHGVAGHVVDISHVAPTTFRDTLELRGGLASPATLFAGPARSSAQSD
jgi:membrane dipeptidase